MSCSIKVIEAGLYTTIQDYPGRVGHTDRGVPISGPMDALAFRLGNRLLGNEEGVAGLECTLRGPTLEFEHDTRICLTGAPLPALLNGVRLPYWRMIHVKRGSRLGFEPDKVPGVRAYLLIHGGLQAATYMHSAATFCLARLDRIRPLREGDQLQTRAMAVANTAAAAALPAELIPRYSRQWLLRVLPGPHGTDEYFAPEFIEAFYAETWRAHHSSSRCGIRLTGRPPAWSRASGGEAGLHPSNIHDIPYTVGAISFTGDSPIILGPDGPTLGGFLCLATVISADQWKLGQIAPGDQVLFRAVADTDAQRLWQHQQQTIRELAPQPAPGIRATTIKPRVESGSSSSTRCFRPVGDRCLLIEYRAGAPDVDSRVRIHELRRRLEDSAIDGITDMNQGIRSLLIQYDSQAIDRDTLQARVDEIDAGLDISGAVIPSRIVRLPLAWNDRAVREAILHYQQSLGTQVPWCPSNIDYVCRLNDLADTEALRRIICRGSYLVMGLGDVYFGAPVATPLDPRDRLLTTKYNPPRTRTPPGAVGLGGIHLCIYSTDSPGGYQLVGRTVPVWNFDRPWSADSGVQLLRMFDRIRFYPATEAEVDERGRRLRNDPEAVSIRPACFRLADYHAFLARHAGEIERTLETRRAAFATARIGQVSSVRNRSALFAADEQAPSGHHATTHITSRVGGRVVRILVQPRDRVRPRQTLLLIDCMKLGIAVKAAHAGVVTKVLCREGDTVAPGQSLAVLDPEVDGGVNTETL